MILRRDFVAGLFFGVLGLAGVLVGRNYRIGTLSAMGPGLFPILISSAIAIIGAIMMVTAALHQTDADRVVKWELRPIFFLTLAIAAFGALIERLGLVVAIMAMVFFARFAGAGRGAVELVVMSAALALLMSAIFVFGLNIPLKLRPW